MILWIIIGSLVGAIAIFLIVMSFRDRKKLKVEKAHKEEQEIKVKESTLKVVVFLKELYAKNNSVVKKFVPSVGKLKMGDIRSLAKTALKDYKQTETYKLATSNNANKENIISVYDEFNKVNSNLWEKQLDGEIKVLDKELKEVSKTDINKFKKEADTFIKKVYA